MQIGSTEFWETVGKFQWPIRSLKTPDAVITSSRCRLYWLPKRMRFWKCAFTALVNDNPNPSKRLKKHCAHRLLSVIPILLLLTKMSSPTWDAWFHMPCSSIIQTKKHVYLKKLFKYIFIFSNDFLVWKITGWRKA